MEVQLKILMTPFYSLIIMLCTFDRHRGFGLRRFSALLCFALPYWYHEQIFVCILRTCDMTAVKTIAFSTSSEYANPNDSFFAETTSLNQW